MAWLMRRGEVLASVELCGGRVRSMAGSNGSASLATTLRKGPKAVHAFGRVGGIDLAWLDDDLVVGRIRPLRANGVAIARWRDRFALESAPGAFERWRLQVGDQLEVKD